MPTAVIDGIVTRYEVVGSGPPLLMYAPGGFNAVVEAWSTLGVYQKIKLLDHLPAHFTCILFDRRECGQSEGRIEPITWPHYVAQGKGLLEHLHISRAHLMGGCMGCAPVAAFAVAHPDMVASLLLYWPVGGAKYRLPRSDLFVDAPITMGIFLWAIFLKGIEHQHKVNRESPPVSVCAGLVCQRPKRTNAPVRPWRVRSP